MKGKRNMNNEEVKKIIEEHKIIAIARDIKPEDAAILAKALYDGGVYALEFPFNMNTIESTQTDECTKAASRAMGDKMCIGCGTVSFVELVDRAYEAGAKYIVAADTNVDVIKRTKELGLISIPGAFTPSEIMKASVAGADYIKIYPIRNLEKKYINEIKIPYSHIKYLAVAGVELDNIKEYIKDGYVGVGLSGNLIMQKYIQSGEFDKITELARQFVNAMK